MSVLLEARDVCMYFGGLKAVESVNMSVNQGDIFGIIGPNGAGKTTFFNVCSGIYQPTKGENIRYVIGSDCRPRNGENVPEYSAVSVYERFG